MRYVTKVVLSVVALAVGLPVSQAAPFATADIQVASFYHWYLAQAGANPSPVMSAMIGRYVTPALLTRLRHAYTAGQFAEGTDYFLKVQDYDEADWTKHVVVASRGNGRALVTIGTVGKVELCVRLMSSNGHWKITRVDEPDLPNASGGCRTRIIEGPAPK